MKILEPIDDDTVHRYSSIDQYRDHFFHILRGERAVPIAFDVLDYFACNECGQIRPYYHRSLLSDGKDIGYHFPVLRMPFFSDLFITFDRVGTETVKTETPNCSAKKLSMDKPNFFGMETYERYFHTRPIIVGDTSSVGHRHVGELKIGLDYILADVTLEPTTDD